MSTNNNGIDFSICLLQDSYGSIIGGQSTERILSLLGASVKILKAVQNAKHTKKASDFKELSKILNEAIVMSGELPPFDREAASVAFSINQKFIRPGILNQLN